MLSATVRRQAAPLFRCTMRVLSSTACCVAITSTERRLAHNSHPTDQLCPGPRRVPSPVTLCGLPRAAQAPSRPQLTLACALERLPPLPSTTHIDANDAVDQPDMASATPPDQAQIRTDSPLSSPDADGHPSLMSAQPAARPPHPGSGALLQVTNPVTIRVMGIGTIHSRLPQMRGPCRPLSGLSLALRLPARSSPLRPHQPHPDSAPGPWAGTSALRLGPQSLVLCPILGASLLGPSISLTWRQVIIFHLPTLSRLPAVSPHQSLRSRTLIQTIRITKRIVVATTTPMANPAKLPSTSGMVGRRFIGPRSLIEDLPSPWIRIRPQTWTWIPWGTTTPNPGVILPQRHPLTSRF